MKTLKLWHRNGGMFLKSFLEKDPKKNQYGIFQADFLLYDGNNVTRHINIYGSPY